MDKSKALLKVAAKNIQTIAELQSYSILDKDVILQYLRATYGVIVQMSTDDAVVEQQLELNNDIQDETLIAEIEMLKRVVMEKGELLNAEIKKNEYLNQQLQSLNEKLVAQQSIAEQLKTTVEGKEQLIISKDFHIGELTEQLAVQKEQFEIEKQDLYLQLEVEKNKERTAQQTINAVIQQPPVATKTVELLTEESFLLSTEEAVEDVVTPKEAIEKTEKRETVTSESKREIESITLDLFEVHEEVAVEEVVIKKETVVEEKQVFVPKQEVTPPAAAAPKKSLSDYLGENREDNSLASRYQNSKINDLAKAISINEKFLFIRELFKDRGEEFKSAVEQLNKCTTDEAAFELLEKFRNHYFWDTSAPAYLAFCDLIRRKFN